MIEDSNHDKLNFYLDPSVFATNSVKRIGIEKSTNSIIVEVCNQTILQTIHIDAFSEKTINPLRKQLSEILIGSKKGEESYKIINSIITCINNKVDKISEFFKENPSNPNNGNEGGKSDVDALIKLALEPENTEKLFKDQNGKVHAAVRLGNDRHLEVLPIEGKKYKRYLSKLYRENIGSSVNDSALSTAVTNLASIAEFDGHTVPLYLRVASGSEENRAKHGFIYYDMCDTQGRIIEISKDGWIMINRDDIDIPIIFTRYNQKAQVEPDRNYPSDIFEKLLDLTNVKNPNHRHLLKVYIISTLIPEIDHPILTTYGPKGSAKSFLLELIKKLIDPSKPILLTLNRNMDQFIQQLSHYYICYYDNVKWIPSWLSDEICKAVTGVGHTKRELYSNDEDVIYEYKRCIGFNGINVALTEPDALDRSVSIELDDIDDEKRRKEKELWNEIEKVIPHTLAYIFDTIVKAIQIKPTLNLKRLPRMADFAEWGEAISQAMGYPPMAFIDAYTENRNDQNVVAVNENLVASLLLKLVQEIENDPGSSIERQYEPQDLYNELQDCAERNRIRIDGRQFPKDGNILVKKIKTVIPNLKAGYGIIVDIGRSADNTSIITVYRKTTTNQKPSTGGTDDSEANYTTFNIEEIESSDKNHNINWNEENVE